MTPATVRVLRGTPGAEELAALLLALHAVTTSTPTPPKGPPPPSAAPWARAGVPLRGPVPAWSGGWGVAWQGG
ncbi:acyl-CoA carboxylase epsilon subunit [Streptomyces geranii]|uniref:acyl-CoA carboxylase epsilon subunit n=1 Tax=Streptomyces geranii TaxID=2058923 RepID=UPI000D03CE15